MANEKGEIEALINEITQETNTYKTNLLSERYKKLNEVLGGTASNNNLNSSIMTNIVTKAEEGIGSGSSDLNASFTNIPNGSYITIAHITKIENLDTSTLTSFNNMFKYLTNLKTLGEIDGSSVRTLNSDTFNCCTLLEEFGGIKDLGKGYVNGMSEANAILRLNSCNNLTYESLLNVVNKAYDIKANGVTTTHTILLGKTNYAKLQATEEGIEAIANALTKGWRIAEQ